MVQHYELMVLFPGTLNEAALAEAKQQVTAAVTEQGKITVQCDLPRRRLAYPIGQQTYGFYSVMQFDLDTAALAKINNTLKLHPNVVRHLLVKAKPQTIEQLQAGLLATPTPEPVAPTVAPASEVVLHSAVPEVMTESTVQPIDKTAGPVSMEELNKKLDAILEDADIATKL